MLWTTFGAALPVFILAIWGAVLAASDPDIAAGLATDPIGELARLSSLDWFPPVLFAAIGLSLVSAVVLNLYSSGFAVQALIPRAERWVGVVAAAVLTAVVTIALVTLIPNLDLLLLDAATTLAVPVAVWAGVFSAEMMLRRRRFTPDSLLRRGGVYPDWRWPNLAMLFIGTAIGFGFMHADIAWLSWEGFLFRAIGINPVGELGTSDIGVLIALGLGLVTPIATGIREIRRQESASR
jgi:purine-cytosine permease-like protein